MKFSMIKIREMLFSKVSRNSLWLLILQGFNTVIPLITLPYITRILSKTAYGEFSIALNLIGYFQVCVEYGFALAGARKVVTSKNQKEVDLIHSGIIGARMLLLFFCVIVFTGVIIIGDFGYDQVICMSILLLMVVATVFQQNWFFQGIAEMQNITVINVVSRLLSVILIFCLVKAPNDLYLYCFIYASNYLLSSFLGCLIAGVKYKVRFVMPKLSSLKSELVDGWPLFVSSAMTKIFGSIGITILGIVSTAEVVGVYSAINKIPYILTILFFSISQAIYPVVCKEFEISFYHGVKKVRKYALPVFTFFFLLGIAIILGNKLIVEIAFGTDYISNSTLLIPFVIWVLFGIINNFLGVQILVASGHQKSYSLAFTVSVVVMISLMSLLGKPYGSYGIAYASMISEMVLSLILFAIIRKENRHRESFRRPNL